MKRPPGQIRAASGAATFAAYDVSDAAEVERLVRRVVEVCGRLDLVHNNAGAIGELCPIPESTEQNWDRLHAIDLKGIGLCKGSEIAQMPAHGSRVIVGTASVAGLVGNPMGALYAAAKGRRDQPDQDSCARAPLEGPASERGLPVLILTAMADEVSKDTPRAGRANWDRASRWAALVSPRRSARPSHGCARKLRHS